MYQVCVNNKILNGAIMYAVSLVLCFILPPYFLFRFMFTFLTQSRSGEDMNGKVVLITGASSGIGEYLAYEYAKKGAFLAIVARRESKLHEVAKRAQALGSPEVLSLTADVSNVDQCKSFVNKTIEHFGRLDHLVNNAGIGSFYSVGNDVTKFTHVMDINFWGSIYPAYFAIPHLQKTKGKIIVNASVGALTNPPKGGFYVASKAALISFYESLRVELAPEISLTIVNLGLVDSEMSQGKDLSEEALEILISLKRNSSLKSMLEMSTEPCARAIVDGVCRGERSIIEPQVMRVLIFLNYFCPEWIDWWHKIVLSYMKRNSKLSETQISLQASS